MAEFIVTDPSGKDHIVTAPDGATQEQALEFAKSQFAQTPGGAAVGNPSLGKQGDKAAKQDKSITQSLTDIGGAAGLGAVAGAFSGDILSGAGRAAAAFPQTARIAPFLSVAGDTLKAGGRAAPAIAGGLAGAIGETTGQAAEAAGAGPTTAEVARIVGGGVGPELAKVVPFAMKLTGKIPLVSDAVNVLKNLAGRDVNLTAEQKSFIENQVSQLRGGAKTDAPLEAVGSLMGNEGQRVLNNSDQQMMAAMRQAGGVGSPAGYPAQPRELADIGGDLRKSITERNQSALDARSQQYTANQDLRDTIVKQREGARQYVNDAPGYDAMLSDIQSQLAPGARSPSVQAGYQRILSELVNPEKDVFGQPKPLTFQALDDVRRKLGDAFRGKPAEGYDAIGSLAAKDLYQRISDIQKGYAGGPGGPQAKLLDEYAQATQGLEPFSSKFGKKTTALDQYRDDQYATDASALPATYFKTRASVQALKELTGNPAQVNAAALDFADKQLAGKSAPDVRAWLGKNSEWLSEVPGTKAMVDRYATRLEDSERSLRNAQDFSKQAQADASLLTRNALPAQRAVDLIKGGNAELWGKVAPVIAQSPQAKVQMVSAVRQVLADQASSKGTADLFSRSIRPFLEQSNIATKAEMDSIAQRLTDIQQMNIPEQARLGLAKRLLLQSSGGWASSAASRTGEKSLVWAIPE